VVALPLIHQRAAQGAAETSEGWSAGWLVGWLAVAGKGCEKLHTHLQYVYIVAQTSKQPTSAPPKTPSPPQHAPLIQPHPTPQVVHRIFPLRRGLYEDYLANWWCATSVLIKWKALAAASALAPACAALTLLAASPSMLQQVLAPSPQGLLLGMVNSAFAFYTFGYQVHEKSILLPLLPVTALAAWEPEAAVWGPLVAAFSMFPLLERDGVALPYAACLIVYATVMLALRPQKTPSAKKAQGGRSSGLVVQLATVGGGAVGLLLHALRLLLPPPERLLWLHDRLFVSWSFLYVMGGMLYFNWRQWNQQQGGRLVGGGGGGGAGAVTTSSGGSKAAMKSGGAESTPKCTLPALTPTRTAAAAAAGRKLGPQAAGSKTPVKAKRKAA